MTHEIAAALFLGMALQSIMNGVVNRGKPVRLSGSILTAGLCLVTAIIIHVLGG